MGRSQCTPSIILCNRKSRSPWYLLCALATVSCICSQKISTNSSKGEYLLVNNSSNKATNQIIISRWPNTCSCVFPGPADPWPLLAGPPAVPPPVSGSPAPCGTQPASPEEENHCYNPIGTCIYTTVLKTKDTYHDIEIIILEVGKPMTCMAGAQWSVSGGGYTQGHWDVIFRYRYPKESAASTGKCKIVTECILLPVQHGVGLSAHHSESASHSPLPVIFGGSPPPAPAPLSGQHTPGPAHQAESADWLASLGETIEWRR